MNNQQTYILNFKANLQGVEDVAKKIKDIVAMPGIADNMTKPMQASLQKFTTTAEAYIKAMMNELSKADPDLKVLKTWDKTLSSLIKQGQSFSSLLSGIQLSPQLNEDFEELTKIIKDATSKIQNLKDRQNQIADMGLDARTKTGYSKKNNPNAGESFETSEFQGISSTITGFDDMEAHLQEFDKGLGTTKRTLEDYYAILNNPPEGLASSIQLLEKYKTIMDQVVVAMKSKSNEMVQERNTNEALIADQRNWIDLAEQEQQQLLESAQSTEGLTNAQKDLLTQIQELLSHLSSLNTQQERTKDEVDSYTRSINNASSNVVALSVSQEKTKDSTNLFTGSVGKAAKQVISYGTIISLLRGAYNRTISTIKDMDKALTDMTVVTSLTRGEAWNLTGRFQELATQTGKTSAEIADITTKFLQQGKSLTQALTLTEAAAKAATIAGISGEKSVDLLTNAMNGFQLAASEAMEVSDKFAALAAASATDYEELATALSKVAAQANLAGMSMDFTLGLLAKGIETTREAPETIGTALKTVVSRMRELSDYGKTLEEGTDVNRVAAALSNVGIELMDTSGQFRDLEDVLTEVGMKWDTLNKNQQANIAVAMAGTRLLEIDWRVREAA